MPADPGLALSVTARLSESSLLGPSPFTRRLSTLSTGPFLLAWWWSSTQDCPLFSWPASHPGLQGCPGEGGKGCSCSDGLSIPQAALSGLHASSPTGRVPQALGDFNGQRARGVRCLQAEGALGSGGGGRGPDPCPDHPVSPCSQHRQLLKDSFMVELVEGARKLRHVFLFTDLLLCTKLKKQSGG